MLSKHETPILTVTLNPWNLFPDAFTQELEEFPERAASIEAWIERKAAIAIAPVVAPRPGAKLSAKAQAQATCTAEDDQETFRDHTSIGPSRGAIMRAK